MIYLKKEITKKIKDDAALYGKVAQALGISAPSLRPLLKANHIKLTQAGALEVIWNHLNKNGSDCNFCIFDLLNIPKYKDEKTGSNTK